MCLFRAKCCVLVLLVLCNTKLLAQTSSYSNPINGRENNPYSKYGIGEFVNGNNTTLRGMANITSAYATPYTVNSDNPASYALLQRTTFEGGGTASTRTVTGSGLTYKTGTATISYVNLGLPVGKNGGLCIGFRPYTHTYYNMVDTITSTTNPPSPIGNVERTYYGEGELNYAYIGAAAKRKGFSIGANVGYLFGTIRNTTATLPIDTAVINKAFITEFSNYTQIGGLYFKLGLMYDHKIDSEYSIRIGGTLSLQQNLVERLNSFQISSHNFGDTAVSDTSLNSGESTGKLKLPLSYTIGVMLTKGEKWSLGLDFAGTQWSGYKSTPDSILNAGVGTSSYKISLGGEYTPDANNIRNYFSRVTYRFGLYYGTDYLALRTLPGQSLTTLPVYGVTAGGSFPFRRSLSRLHVAIDVGRLGTTTNNLIQQTYARFTIGVSLNDKWFIPRKYD